MINVIIDLTDEQKEEVIQKLTNFDYITVCRKCNALIQFEERDVNRQLKLPHLGCPCGNSIQLHSKYYKMK